MALLKESYSLKKVVKPSLKENEVLIKVKATTINDDYDWSMVTGCPLVYRLLFGLKKPKNSTPGMELSGTIAEVGSQVQRWQVGDAVYGDISHYGTGSFAEYLTINQNAIVQKPAKLDGEKAAATPHAFLLAWQAMRDKLKKNQKVLVNGAGGGVGIFALQIAKLLNCQVVGVDS